MRTLFKTMLIISILASIVFHINTFASYPVDVYGTSKEESRLILKEHAKKVAELSQFIIAYAKEPHHKTKKEISDAGIRAENIKRAIKQKYHFLYVNFSITVYPNKEDNYVTTIEVIRKDNPERLYFTQKEHIEKIPHKKRHPHDLVDAMIQFTQIESELFKNQKLKPIRTNCPAYHCSPGLVYPKLRDYLKLFNLNAVKQKKLILNTLKNDSDLERRAAAIFLVGHFNDPHEVISVLLPYIKDQNSYIRNNALLIIVTTMEVAKIHQIDIMQFHDFLDSPYVTDRNKALGILSKVIESDTSKKNITQNYGRKLIELLQLKQPNNHDLAYVILKKISGKDFGEYNILAWKNWLSDAQKECYQGFRMKKIAHCKDSLGGVN